METPPDPGDTKDFRFEKLSEFVAWNPDQEASFKSVIRGASVANRFGLAFCVAEKGFHVVDCASPSLSTKSGSAGEKLSLNAAGAFPVGLEYQPVLLSVSSSGMTLAVCVVRDQLSVAFLYDVRAFSQKDPQTQPFHTVQLSSQPGVTVTDFAWIPTNEESFVVVLSSGSLALFELKDTATTILGSLSDSAGATCVSWSPKGKQFVVGKLDGSLAQYKPDLTSARSISGPKNLTVQTKNILWLSTFVFAVTYKKPSDSHPALVIVNAPKTGDPVFSNFDDICCGFTDRRVPFYHLWPIFEWNVVLAASNNALEIGVLSCQSQDQTTGWLQLMLEETARAEAPLVGSDESFVLGMGVITCTSFPVLLLATTLGVVATFRIVNTMRINGAAAANICSPPEPIASVAGERPQLSLPSAAVPATKFKVPSEAVASGAAGSIFGGSAAGLFGSSPASGFGFGLSAASSSSTTSNLFGSKPAGSLFGGGGLVAAGTGEQQQQQPQPSEAPVPSGFSFSVPSAANTYSMGKTVTPTQSTAKQADVESQPKSQEDTSSTVSTTIVSRKATQSPASIKPAVAVPAQIPSRQLKQFMQKVTALGKRLEILSVESNSNEDAEMQHRMDALTRAFDDLTEYFDDAALKINEQERTVEERLHVVEEAMLIIERCSDSQFLELLKNLPLEPLQRRKFEVLERNVTEMEHKLRTIQGGLDMELDMMEARRGERKEDQGSIVKRIIDDLETLALQLQKRLHELEKKARRFGPPDRSRKFQGEAFSPAESISRLYPDLSQFSSPKTSSAFVTKLRNNIKSAPVRVTRHEVVLFQRVSPEKPTAAKGRTFALPSASEVQARQSSRGKQEDTEAPQLSARSSDEKPTSMSMFASLITSQRASSSPSEAPPRAFLAQPQTSDAICKPGTSASLFASLGMSFEKPEKTAANQPSVFSSFGTSRDTMSGSQPAPVDAKKQEPSAPAKVDESGFNFSGFKTPSAVAVKAQSTPQKDVVSSSSKPESSGFGSGNFKSGLTESAGSSSASSQNILPAPATETFSFGGFKAESSPSVPKSSEDKPKEVSTVGSMIKSALLKSTADNAAAKAVSPEQGPAASDKAPAGAMENVKNVQSSQAAPFGNVELKASQPESKPTFVGFHTTKTEVKDAPRNASPDTGVPSTKVPATAQAVVQPKIPVPAIFASPPAVSLTTSVPAPVTPAAAPVVSLFSSGPAPQAGAPFTFAPKEIAPTNPFDKPLFGSGALSSFGSSSSPFGASPTSKPFGEQPVAADAGTPKPAFGSGGFGGGSPFGTPTKASEPEKSAFGGNVFSGLSLGSTSAPPKEPNKNPFALPGFGNATPSSAVSTGLFSSNSFSAFASPSAEPKPVQASASSTFPSSAFEPAKPIWGAPAPLQQAASGFGGFKLDTSSPAFGSSPFSAAPNPFAAQAAASGFPTSSGFGSFGAPASSGFGAPAFGAPAASGFGSAPAFGAAQPAASGGAIWNQPGGFAAYAGQPSVSFGAVAAQGGQTNAFGQPAQPSSAPPQNAAFTQYR